MRLLYKTGPMESLRKWFYKPKRDDRSLLAQFFFADDALNIIAAELDSFDGRKDPERCSTLVNQLRHAQVEGHLRKNTSGLFEGFDKHEKGLDENTTADIYPSGDDDKTALAIIVASSNNLVAGQ